MYPNDWVPADNLAFVHRSELICVSLHLTDGTSVLNMYHWAREIVKVELLEGMDSFTGTTCTNIFFTSGSLYRFSNIMPYLNGTKHTGIQFF